MTDVLIRPNEIREPARSGAVLSARTVTIAQDRGGHRSGVTLGSQVPPWLGAAFEELTAFAHLPPNWDGYHALPVDGTVLEFTADLIQRFPPSLPKPDMTPTAQGGITIEWNPSGMCLSLTLTPESEPTFYVEVGDEWWEGPIVDVPDAISSMVAKVRRA